MRAGHTPGPWLQTKDSQWNDVARIGRAWIIGTALPLAEMGHVDADARLIAESPAMLDLLKQCRDYLSCIPESAAGGDDDAVRLTRLCDALIRKLEGTT